MKDIFKKKSAWILILTVILTTFISTIKYREGEINYYNSDATWHTLLTIEAYNETPISRHLFLPIVSLGGGRNNKNIPWGATVPDQYGNYYYTSFSPAGYVLPWLFFKIFNLTVCERSLYIFNSILFIISTMLWVKIISYIYRKNKYVNVITLCALLTYICAPEILHGMGIVYWHQSIFQVTFLIQLYAYLKLKESNSKSAKFVFYIITLINPYIEWTGYVANVGLSLVELMLNWKDDKKVAVKKCLFIGILTICSFVIFCLHYLLILDIKTFMLTLKSRFLSRNISTNIPISSLIIGYFTSFKFLWVLLFILIIWNYTRSKKLELENRIVILLLLFPIIENIIMKQHAISYSYDRMKLIFPLSLLICEIIRNILYNSTSKKIVIISILSLFSICCLLNIKSYINDKSYIWEINYRGSNKKLANYINKNYSNSVLGLNRGVRGYINMLFKKGVYEITTYDYLKEIAKSRDNKYIVMIFCNYDNWKIYKINSATVYDTNNNIIEKIKITDAGKIKKLEKYK